MAAWVAPAKLVTGRPSPDPPSAATKVVATVGPAIQDVDVMVQLLHAGMCGIRMDLTWGPLDYHRKSLQNLQLATKKARRLCCTMVDTLGRELMIRRQVSKAPSTGGSGAERAHAGHAAG